MFKINDMIESYGNKKWNEDNYVIFEDLVCVLDGATPINQHRYNEYNTLAEWIVSEFVKSIKKYEYENVNFIELTDKIVQELKRDSFISSLESFDKPCFTLAAIQDIGEEIATYVIGDCAIYVELKSSEIIYVYDDRVDKFSSKTLSKVINARQKKINPKQTIFKQKIENRKFMNKEGGFWTVALEGNFKEQFLCRNFKKAEISKILVCSDGFDRIFNTFNILNISDILDKKLSLTDAVMLLRNREEEYFNHINFPCVKKSDDATAILFQIEEM